MGWPRALALAALAWIWTSGSFPLTISAAEPAAPPAPRPLTFEELFGDAVIARGNGVSVKQSELDRAYTAYRSNLAARGQRVPESQRTMRETQLLQRMIITQLLTNQASRMDHTVAAGLAEKFYTETKQSAGSDETFARQLAAAGMSPEAFNQRVIEQALAEAVIERELKANIKVTEEEVKAFYETGRDELVVVLQEQLQAVTKQPGSLPVNADDLKEKIAAVQKGNLDRMQQPEKVRVSHILISTRPPDDEKTLSVEELELRRFEADKVLARARAGEDFQKLVTEFSQDRHLAETGGEYTFSRDEPYATEFKAASFTLEPGQISDIVTTVFGFHIIKLLEKIPAQKVPFETVAPEIKKFLTQQKLQRQMPAYFRKLKEASAVEILEPKYRTEISDADTSIGPDLPLSK